MGVFKLLLKRHDGRTPQVMEPRRRWAHRISAALLALLGLLAASHSFAQSEITPRQLAPKRLAERYRAVIDAKDLTDDEKRVLLSALEKCAGEHFYMSKVQKDEAIDILKALLKVAADANPWWIGFVSGGAEPREFLQEMAKFEAQEEFRKKEGRYLPSECLSTHPGS